MSADNRGPITAALRRGATFERVDGKHYAVMRKRGRAQPLAKFEADSQEEAARMLCDYFHIKSTA